MCSLAVAIVVGGTMIGYVGLPSAQCPRPTKLHQAHRPLEECLCEDLYDHRGLLQFCLQPGA